MKYMKTILALSALFLALYWVEVETTPEVRPTQSVQHVNSPQIKAIGDRLGVKLPKTVVDEGSCVEGANACYQPSTDTVYVLPETLNRSELEVNRVLAHEYLHFVWEKDGSQFAGLLKEMYGTNPQLQDRMQWYEDRTDEQDFIAELYAIVGTEMDDSSLPFTLLEHYQKYLPNRGALPSYLR